MPYATVALLTARHTTHALPSTQSCTLGIDCRSRNSAQSQPAPKHWLPHMWHKHTCAVTQDKTVGSHALESAPCPESDTHNHCQTIKALTTAISQCRVMQN